MSADLKEFFQTCVTGNDTTRTAARAFIHKVIELYDVSLEKGWNLSIRTIESTAPPSEYDQKIAEFEEARTALLAACDDARMDIARVRNELTPDNIVKIAQIFRS